MVTPKSSNEGCRFTESPTKPFRTSPTSSDPKKKMYKRVRPLYTILLLLIAAASLTTLHLFNLKTRAHKPPFNQTLLRQAEVDINEPSLNQEIEDLLGENYRSTVAQMSVRYTFRYLGPHELHHLWSKFKQSLSEWSEKRAALNRSGVFSEFELRVRYNSCAVVGNSGILLGSRHGQLVDSHEAVIRLNNARTEGHERDVGSRTSVSFVNSNVLHACARRGVGCAFCHVYGEWVPMVTYACQLAHLVDCLVCNSSRPGSVILTDPRFDVLCARIVKYYSLRRFGGGGGWAAARGGKDFHYSSGMQAVMMAAGVCRRVSLFGFGKSGRARHHYHTRQVAELSLHDYEAEYDFYRDLVAGRGGAVPFVAEGFEFPPVVMYQ